MGDQLALGVQELRNRAAQDRPLLRIDNRDEAKKAPYQFDSVAGRLHRRGCEAIPESSKSALYGVWRVDPGQQELACPRCRPAPASQAADESFTTDLFYGVVSILDQFGNILRERGREYRRSREGQRLPADLDGLYRNFGEREKEVLGVVVSALDGIVKSVRDFDGRLHGSNGAPANGANGASGNGANGSAPAHRANGSPAAHANNGARGNGGRRAK